VAENVVMTYVVTGNRIKCKYIDCVEVCPVECFYEGENMLVIHPTKCIDCGVCEPERRSKRFSRNGAWKRGLAEAECRLPSVWPNITMKRLPPVDANEFDGINGKLERCFSESPGQGD
jgi:ferredoxin